MTWMSVAMWLGWTMKGVPSTQRSTRCANAGHDDAGEFLDMLDSSRATVDRLWIA
jgi:hypothetical protein